MDSTVTINSIYLIIGIAVTLISSITGLVIAISERRNKQADYTEKINRMSLGLITPLSDEVKDLSKQVETLKKNDKDNHCLIISLQETARIQEITIQSMSAMLREKDRELIERDRVIIHLQSQILTLQQQLAILEQLKKEV